MNERELARRLLTEPAPGELDAATRAWPVVRAAYAEREPAKRAARRARPLLAVALAGAVVAAAVTSPGRAVGDWIRDAVVGREPAEEALVSLPTAGRLLVLSEQGPWIVRRDGSKRLLGDYDEASWSPRGLFVVAARGPRLVALEPDGDPRWTVTRRHDVADPRWSPSGFRIAYRSGRALRVVAGNGEADRLVAPATAAVAPAWRPGRAHVLAFADPRGALVVVDTDTGAGRARTHLPARARQLSWSADGRRLAVLVGGRRVEIYRADARRVGVVEAPRGHTIAQALFGPRGRHVALTEIERGTGSGAVVLVDTSTGRRDVLFRGPGKLTDLAWSPDGRWLLVGWPPADQWLFLRVPGVRRIVAVSNIASEFDPGAPDPRGFPHAVSWCCSASGSP